MKIAFSYMSIILFVLVLLNTYPVYVSQTFVYRYKQNSIGAQASLMTATLSGLDELTSENVSRGMAVLDSQGAYRVIVVNDAGLIVYDNSASYSTEGRYAMQSEIIKALSGRDVFRSQLIEHSFESRLAIPVMSQGRVIGAVYLYDYDPTQAAMLSGLRSNLSTFSVVITVVFILLSIFISMALTRRITGLMHAIRAVRNGDYSQKAPIKGRDELSQVAGQFNDLSDILYKTEKLRQQFVSDASHELKTPLASIRLLADSILQTDDMDIGTIREFMADIGQEIDRLGRMTEKLMLLTRLESSHEPPSGMLDPVAVILRAVHMLDLLAQAAEVKLRCELSEGCQIHGSEDDLYQIVYNLIENAIKYNHPGGTVRILCYPWEDFILLEVDDTGVGIPEEDLPRVFERFYRVDKARSREAGGTGLGLSIVSQTIERMGGTVQVESVYGKGTSFRVLFPLEVSYDDLM